MGGYGAIRQFQAGRGRSLPRGQSTVRTYIRDFRKDTMSVHVRQLEQYFTNAVANSIDTTDLAGKSADEVRSATLSRSLTAFSICGLTGASIAQAAAAVLDGSRDQGIDGCFFDESKNSLVFVQSKWHTNGTKTISKGDLLKFLHGIKLVLAANWDTFSEKFKRHKATIDQALLKPDVSVVVAVAFTGDNPLGDECKEVLEQFEQDQNSVTEYLEVKTLDLKALHRYFRTATLSAQPPFTAMLLDWGQSTEPYRAVYGRICCTDLAKLYSDIGEPLFEPNIRSFLGDGEVNNQIIATLAGKPEEFWYLNNGITAICTQFTKTAFGGDTRQAGTFIFQGLQIVNGAQTVGSIAKASEKYTGNLARAFAMIKVISLEGSPLGFTDVVTVATNRQNRVEEKDFLALDPNQTRLKNELHSKGIQYVFRSGEAVVDKAKGFDAQEIMIALACADSNVAAAVLAKRNIGLLLDRKSSIYTSLFSPALTGEAAWRLVEKSRMVDLAIQKIMLSEGQRRKQILTHGNRVITWAAFNVGNLRAIDNADLLFSLIGRTAERVEDFIRKNYPDSYLAVFFKNTQKCVELSDALKADGLVE